jgi:hypothetical protein
MKNGLIETRFLPSSLVGRFSLVFVEFMPGLHSFSLEVQKSFGSIATPASGNVSTSIRSVSRQGLIKPAATN